MSDVELVIKIPEEIYKHILSMQFYIPGFRSGKSLLEKILKAIRTGKLLPKGHGNLIDTKEFIKAINDWADDLDNYEAYEELEIAKELLQNHAHTIIDANREQEE